MSSRPDKCRTCNGSDREIGDYCAECTLDFIVDRWGWNQQWWFTATMTGGTRGGKPKRRADKRALLRQAMRVYALSYGTKEARAAFMDAVRAILLKWPCYRSFGTAQHKDSGYRNPRHKNLNYAVRRFASIVERRIRKNVRQQGELASDDFRDDYHE
jgi:hypothetical protein